MGSEDRSSDVVEASDLLLLPHSGRVVSDERGNSIWEWRRHDGSYSRELSAEDLERLIEPLRALQGRSEDVRMMTGTWRYEVQRDVVDLRIA